MFNSYNILFSIVVDKFIILSFFLKYKLISQCFMKRPQNKQEIDILAIYDKIKATHLHDDKILCQLRYLSHCILDSFRRQ